MDATELIEEAGRVAAQAAKQSALDLYYSPCTCSAPPRGHTTRQHDYRRLQVDELRAVLDVVERLAAALKASEERATAAELDAASLRAAWKIADRTSLTAECQAHAKTSFDLLGVAKERDALAAANLAANKRIVELEHERDEERRKVDALLESSALLRDERDAARAELARLTTPRPIAEAPRNSGSQIIALWMDGDVVESMDVVVWADMDDGEHPERKFWMNMAGDSVEHMTHYLPMPEVKRPCWEPKP